jgi:hypothetical protein
MGDVLRKIRYVANYLLERDIAGRGFEVFPDDILLVSYPKSGNTWLRFLVGNMMNPNERITFANVEQKVPDIYAQSKLGLKKTPRPRVIKSHECFDPRYRRVIYVVRDPRDVAVSAYHYDRKGNNIPDDFPIEKYIIKRFLETTEYFGTWGKHTGSWLINSQNISQLCRVKDDFVGTAGAWDENVLSWLGARGHDRDFLLLRYEDLLLNTQREMGRIADFLRLNVSEDAINRAVELSSSQSMRKLEGQQSREWVTTKPSRQDIPFVRAARAGQWRDVLPKSSVREIEAAWGTIMRLLGYELSSQPDVGN